VEGQDRLLFDPNCKCFDPTTQTVLNPAAWTDAAPGTYGTSAPYYNEYRWQRQPQESMSLGRNFVLQRDRGIILHIRAELFNVFNRTFLASPIPVASFFPSNFGANPAFPTIRNPAGAVTAGYGFVNTFNGAGTSPRTGQIVARFTF
jgi:hypothetical protein